MDNPLLNLIRAYPDKPWNRTILSGNPWLTYEIINMDHHNWKGKWSYLEVLSNINITWNELFDHLTDINWYWFCRNNRFIGRHLEKLVSHPDVKHLLDWEKIHLNGHVSWETICNSLDDPRYHWNRRAILAHAPLQTLCSIFNYKYREVPLDTPYAHWFTEPLSQYDINSMRHNFHIANDYEMRCVMEGIMPASGHPNPRASPSGKDVAIEAFNNYLTSPEIKSHDYDWEEIANHPAIDPLRYIEYFGFTPALIGNPRITNSFIEEYYDDKIWTHLSSNPFSRHSYYLGPKKEKRKEIVTQILYRTDPPLLPLEICVVIASFT